MMMFQWTRYTRYKLNSKALCPENTILTLLVIKLRKFWSVVGPTPPPPPLQHPPFVLIGCPWEQWDFHVANYATVFLPSHSGRQRWRDMAERPRRTGWVERSDDIRSRTPLKALRASRLLPATVPMCGQCNRVKWVYHV